MPGTVPASPVLEFYSGAKIFVTGGTGFLGKTLIEKFLRACPSVDHIYILVREKKGKDPQSRMKDIFNDPLFNLLRQEKPDFEKKVTCIPGDVSSERLGMSDNDYDFLINEVTHVFHSAATVRFNEQITTALNINVRGTHEIIELCNKSIRLKAFIHISTAYANCVKKEILEDFYEPPLEWDKALRLIDTLGEEKLNSISEELIKPWPNTYSFTKAIAEIIIKEKGKSLPAAVFRPAIVMGCAKEPLQGWVDNIYGPTGMIAAVGIGLLRVVFVDKSNVANVIPVDLTVNAIITCAWEVGTNFQNNAVVENSLDSVNSELAKTVTIPKVYNFVVDNDNGITWKEFVEKTLEFGVKIPSEKAFWYYSVTLTKFKFIYFSLIFFLHYVPAAIIDAFLILVGKKPLAIKAYKKIHLFSSALFNFVIIKWRFDNTNIKKLWSRLGDEDKKLFDFDMTKFEWNTYASATVAGIRTFILRDPNSSLPAARRKMFFLWLGHRLLQFIFYGLCFWILGKLFFSFPNSKTQMEDPILRAPQVLNNSV